MPDFMSLFPTAIAFIDSALPDIQNLCNGIAAGIEVIIIDRARDGVAQITEVLGSRSNIKSIHIISHGRSASLQLGAIDLNLTNLKKYASQLQQWSAALAESAEILLYGCEVAAGQKGANFVQQISVLTQAKIAASRSPIGSATKGGDWELDYTTGRIVAGMAIDQATMAAYQFTFGLQFLGQAPFAASTIVGGTQVGGLSGLTYDAGNSRYYAISDGRNIPGASPGPSRFYTLTIPNLSSVSLAAGGVTFTGVTQIGNPPTFPFAADTSDTEGIALIGSNFFVSSEGNFSTNTQPFINSFAIATGQQNLALPISFPKYDALAATTTGIRNNQGFESLTITPSQSFLFTATENALEQDGPASDITAGARSRILRYDLATNTANGEFLYNTDPRNGISEMLAVDDNTLLVLERFLDTSTNPPSGDLKLYQISLNGATDIQTNTGLIASGLAGITPVSKTPIATAAYFSTTGTPPLIDNFEGMTFGPPQTTMTANGKRTLILVSDNNFAIPTRFAAFAANNAPVLNNSGSPVLTAINEDVPSTSNTGSLVSALIAGAVTDPDTSDIQGIAVTATDNTNGSWQYSTNSGATWTAFGTPSTAAARLLAGNASIRFLPNANYNGSANITYQAWDGTTTNSGAATFTNGGTADFSSASSIGGLAAFSIASETATITVNPVNDAPSFVKGPDSSAIAGGGSQTVNNWATTISKGPADESTQTVSFSLSNNNNSLFSVQPAIDSAGNLIYTPASGVSGIATVSATLSDNGGIANGGTDTSAAQTFAINITADTIVPTAANLLASSNILVAGGTTETFTVDYSDNVAVNSSSLDNSDIRVTGPNGFNQLATRVSFTPAGNGTLRTATYQIVAPGGSWDLGDNGNYAIAIESGQVSDINNNFVAASNLGSFNVNIPNPGSFNFNATNYNVAEDAGSATITVTRTSNTVAANVSYSNADGTANAGSDYTATSGTLNFAIGETSKTFTIPINDDTLVEGSEIVALSLNNPTNGASVGAQSTATLTILDNDVAATPTSPTPTSPTPTSPTPTSPTPTSPTPTSPTPTSPTPTSPTPTSPTPTSPTPTSPTPTSPTPTSPTPTSPTPTSPTPTSPTPTSPTPTSPTPTSPTPTSPTPTSPTPTSPTPTSPTPTSPTPTSPTPTSPTPTSPTPTSPTGTPPLQTPADRDCSCEEITLPAIASIPRANAVDRTFNGTDRNDFLIGSNLNDAINGFNGNDILLGQRGNDNIYGGLPSNVPIGADTDDDLLSGGNGNDYLNGNAGNDLIFAGKGDDVAIGGKDNDSIWGDKGNDTLVGYQGNDCLFGGTFDPSNPDFTGHDLLFGDEGNDFLNGGDAADTLGGGEGDDTVYGGKGDDVLVGGIGDDLLLGDRGSDRISGGGGDDTILGDSAIGLNGEPDSLCGGEGNDLMFGNGGVDELCGDSGNDTIYGGKGDDSVSGSIGDDWLIGGLGKDTLQGGSGRDYFILTAGQGDDVITDFTKGEDLLVLTNGLKFDRLSFIQQNSATLIKIANTGELLAVLNGISAIGQQDFTII